MKPDRRHDTTPRRAGALRGDPTKGQLIVVVAWVLLAITAVVAVGAAVGIRGFEATLTVVGLVSFGVGFVVWIVSFAIVLARSARGDDIAVSSWVFLSRSAPARVRRDLLGCATLTLVLTIATTVAGPFVWLTNLLPLGLASLWGARLGTFPVRATTTGASGGRPGK